MSRKWNGKALVDELSALLGDTSATFKNRVLGWFNDTLVDISNAHDWGHYSTTGKKILSSDDEVHDLEVVAPEAPTVELATGGSLELNGSYKFLITFVQSNGVESLAGDESQAIITTEGNLSVKLSNIPTTPESFVSKRRVYISKDDGDFLFHTEIQDNFSTVLTISTETSSTIEPPDLEAIRKIKGAPYFEDQPSNYLYFKDIDQLRMIAQGRWSKGSPQYFSPIDDSKLSLYPLLSVDTEISFNYYRNPLKLYYETSSVPDIPANFKPVLKAGVIALGYEYRDRSGQEDKFNKYTSLLEDLINRNRLADADYSVKDVYGNTDGYEVG